MPGGEKLRVALITFSLALALPPEAFAGRKCGTEAIDAPQIEAVWSSIETSCNCASFEDGGNRKGFVRCAKGVALEAVRGGTLRKSCRGRLLKGAKNSTCGRPADWSPCCYSDSTSRTTCRIRKHPTLCNTSWTLFAQPGEGSSCLDACADIPPLLCWDDHECDDGDPCTKDWCHPAEGCNNLAIAGCVPGGGGGGNGGTACTGNGESTWGWSGVEQALFARINEYRSARGVSAVGSCNSLDRAAQDHANDMRNRNYFSHVGANGSEFWDRACDAGYQAGCGPRTWMGEIIAAANSTADATFSQWVNSPGHESILASAAYTVAVIGHSCGGAYGHYWVMFFAAADEASCR